MVALPVQGVVGLIVGGQVIVFCTCPRHQLRGGLSLSLRHLSSLSCDFGFSLGFSFGLSFGFGFCGESPMGEEIVCEAREFPEVKVCSWMDVVLVDEVRG